MGGVGDVARHALDLPASVTYQARGLLGVVLLVEIGQQQVGTLAGKGNCHSPTDSLSPPVMTATLPARRPEPL